jgi:D-lactate dehydrogenase
MRIAVFSTQSYDREHLGSANAAHGHDLAYLEPRLTIETAALADGFPAVCCFVNDDLGAAVLIRLARGGVRLIALRCAGFNHVDLVAAGELGLRVARVPQYSPDAIAEHTIGMILTLNRKLHRAYARVRDGNFSLEGLEGFELRGRTAGVVGTGAIGSAVARILRGFGCNVLATDLRQDPGLVSVGVQYAEFDQLLADSDIITLHCPLTDASRHMIGVEAVARMKRGVMLINTSRGALVDTRAVIDGLKSGRIGYLGIDVYEEEENLFFRDLSTGVIRDDVFARLLTFPNVLVTAHQGFFTHNALARIASTTLSNVTAFERNGTLDNEVLAASG